MILDVEDSFVYLMRQNAVMKIYPAYLTFTANALFTTANMVEEIILNDDSNKTNEDISAKVAVFMDENKQWLRDRFTEGVLNSMIGGPCDEGMFAQVRKMFMMLLIRKRCRDTRPAGDISMRVTLRA